MAESERKQLDSSENAAADPAEEMKKSNQESSIRDQDANFASNNSAIRE
jgi:hypothetical protein